MPKGNNPDQRILILDIEWKPTKAYVWRPWKENVSADQIIEHGGLLCVGMKWLGQKKVHLYSEWQHGHEEMLARTHEMLSHADAVVTYNGDKYDLRKLEGEFLLHGFEAPPQVTSIDLLKAVKKYGYFMNKLGFIGPFLGLGGKLEHEGINLWIKVIDGNRDAQKRMAGYCKQDVELTEQLYLKIRPYIRNHPHMGNQGSHQCGACGGSHLHSRGTRRTRMYKIQRLQCQDCGAWQDGTRSKIETPRKEK